MRKQYETEQDKIRERKFADDLSIIFDKDLYKMHYINMLDFAGCLKGTRKIVEWIEVKHLNRKYRDYRNFMMSLPKWLKGIEYNYSTGLPFKFAVRLNDGDYCFEYNSRIKDSTQYDYCYKGRTRTARDAQDVEPVVYIPREEFQLINYPQIQPID